MRYLARWDLLRNILRIGQDCRGRGWQWWGGLERIYLTSGVNTVFSVWCVAGLERHIIGIGRVGDS